MCDTIIKYIIIIILSCFRVKPAFALYPYWRVVSKDKQIPIL